MSREIVPSDQALETMRQSVVALDEAMREEGIHPHTPLGLWSRSVCRAMESLAAVAVAVANEMRDFRHEASEIVEMSKRDMATAKQQLAEGYGQVLALKEAGEIRIRNQQTFLEREKQAAIDKVVVGLTTDLKKEVFDAIRKRIPANEHEWYRQTRFNAYAKMILAGAVLVLLGCATGLGIDWNAAATGRFCEANQQVDSKSGMVWCPLVLPDNGSSSTGGSSG